MNVFKVISLFEFLDCPISIDQAFKYAQTVNEEAPGDELAQLEILAAIAAELRTMRVE